MILFWRRKWKFFYLLNCQDVEEVILVNSSSPMSMVETLTIQPTLALIMLVNQWSRMVM
jgi:hypothetical protein